VLAVDISANMLKKADESAREADLTNFDTRVMNAENLELEANSFDAVICRIALMSDHSWTGGASALVKERAAPARTARRKRSIGF
jgi:SAM-dependent methyltransferase